MDVGVSYSEAEVKRKQEMDRVSPLSVTRVLTRPDRPIHPLDLRDKSIRCMMTQCLMNKIKK